MQNSNFYKVNFEKEIVVQGRTTLFLSIEATNFYKYVTASVTAASTTITGSFTGSTPIPISGPGIAAGTTVDPTTNTLSQAADETVTNGTFTLTQSDTWSAGDSLYVLPYIQPQTFESKFEGWTYAPISPMPQPNALLGRFRIYFRPADFAKAGTLGLSGWNAIQVGDDVKAVSMWKRTMPGQLASATNGVIDSVKFGAKVLAKGYSSTNVGTNIPLYWIEIDSALHPTALPIGRSFLLQIGEWKADDNWYINQVKASEVALDSLKNATYTVSNVAPNQFDGQDSGVGWPSAADYATRSATGAGNLASFYVYTASQPLTNPPRITYRIDYDGVADSHLKINFLIAKENTTPANWSSTFTGSTELAASDVLYGQKLSQSVLTAIGGHVVDYQEVHLFGYTETAIRPERSTYQNAFQASGNEVYDDLSSFGVLKTNPKLTGNVKLTVDSGGLLWLNSFDSSQELSSARFKKYAVNPSSSFQRDLFYFFDEGQLPSQLVYQVYEKDTQYLNTKRSYDEQYDNFYNYGVEQLNSKFYDEDYTFLAPLWMRKRLPDFFVIFRVDHPLTPLSYQEVSNAERFSDFFQNARIVKTFDMRESSPLGTYLRKLTEDPRFVERPLEVSFDQDVQTTWHGINYSTGNITGKGEFLYDFWRTDSRILDFEESITGGFERSGLISTNLINLEFLFNDEEATPYSINRYFGFYVSENDLAEFEILPEILGAIPGQTPTPKPGVDGQPFNLQPFVQTNESGIELPVDYFHNPTDGTTNTSATPEYTGLVNGKFPLPPMLEDPLRIFYVKDRFGRFKRVNQLTEKNYGNPGAPNFRRATQLRLFDTQENISDYGGITQLSSQSSADLLDGGNAQLAIFIEDLLQDGKPIADYETLEIYLQKLNTEERNFYYRLEVTAVTGTVVEFAVQKNDTGTFAALPADYLTTIEVDTANPDDYGYVDSYLSFLMVGGVPAIGDSWEVGVVSGNIEYANAVVGTAPPSLTFYGEAEYPQYRWLLEANPVGLSPGEAWDYPVYDPRNRYYKNTFCNRGTPKQVATAIAECINNFNPKIVEAKAVGTAVYMKALPKWEDGNKILFSRSLKKNISVPKNLGFYEKANADRGAFTSTLYGTPVPPSLNLDLQIKDSTQVYEDKYYYINATLTSPGSWVVNIRKDVDPANPLFTGYAFTYANTPGTTLLQTEEFDVDLAGTGSFTAVYQITWGSPSVQQYFVGGVKRKRARARLKIADGKRYYADRKTTITGNLTAGSSTITGVVFPNALYVGAPITGTGIPTGSIVIALKEYTGEITISKNSTVTNSAVTITVGETSILNSTQVYQQWFQVQRGNFSRMRGWSVQGKYVYSLPNLEAPDFSKYNEYSIIQIDRDRDEFYYTPEKTVIAYQVYRPMFGLFTLFPIKAFDVDTYFSEYSYAPTIEMLRYFNREETNITSYNSTTQLSYISIDPVNLNMNENYDMCIVLEDGTPPANETVDIEAYLQFYDTNDKEWKLVDRIVSRVYLENEPQIAGNSDQAVSLKTVMFNTCYPLYFYDTLEVPNDYIAGSATPGPYNAVNTEPTPAQDQSNNGPQYTAAGTRNFVRKRMYSKTGEECNFTKARIGRVQIWKDFDTGTHHTFNFKWKLRVQGSNYYRDKDVTSFQGFSTVADFLNEDDLNQIQVFSNEKSFEKFTYQMLLSEYDRLRENQQKDLAVKSKVVPSILKWVQEGTDARDNYYRLNNSTAFGITNFSPDPQVEFVEPLLLTHEFPYLDNVPKDYPQESLEGSRSYFFQKLSDIAYNGKSWYDLLTSDSTNDWFLKYFVVGAPTEISPDGETINKSREERYTFFKYIEGLDLSQTLFRGAKINVIDYDTAASPRVPINESSRFDLYKFAAIARFVTYSNFGNEKPIQIEVIDNEVYKTILVIITVYVQDYRLQAGLGDYAFFYYAIDQLRNSMQTQTVGGWGSKTDFFRRSQPSLNIFSPDMRYPAEMPYTISTFSTPQSAPHFQNFLNASQYFYTTTAPWSVFTEDVPKAFNISRYRQFFFGGGRLELDDVKIGGNLWIADEQAPVGFPIDLRTIFEPLPTPTDGTSQYPFITKDAQSIGYYPVSTEVFPALDNYRTGIDYFLGGWNSSAVNTFTGNQTAGSNVITSVSQTLTEEYVGLTVTGTGVPTNTKIESISGTTITLTNNVTSTIVGATYTIYINYGYPIFSSMPTSVDFTFSTIPMTVDGSLSEISVMSKKGTARSTYTIYDALQTPEVIRLDNIFFSSSLNAYRYSTLPGLGKGSALVNSTSALVPLPGTLNAYPPYIWYSAANNFEIDPLYDLYQTFNLRGGTGFYQEKKRLISYASIVKMFNEDSTYILYRKIDSTGAYAQTTPDYSLRFVSFDALKKTSRTFYKDDTDRPLEYQNTDFIGFDSVDSKEQEFEFRHRGLYEPKTLEVVSFWAREDQSFTQHYEKDFILKNTHINGDSQVGGLLRNYNYNKVADREVLQIARTSSYKSLYPLIGEVAIDKRDLFALNSCWDSGFYRKYRSTTAFQDVAGTEEMKETKVFLASKVMAVPKTFDLHTFTRDEVQYQVIQPKKSIGVTTLTSPDTAESNKLETKPLLRIKINLEERLKRALLEGILESTSMDEFEWFNTLGIPALTYTVDELNTLKREYIEKNIIPLYEVDSVTLYSTDGEGLPILDLVLTESDKAAAGYRLDKNISTTITQPFIYLLEKALDTKAPNAFSLSAVLKRI